MKEKNGVVKQTVIVAIIMMSKSIGIKPMSYETLDVYSTEQLLVIQESLIIHYNRSVKR